MRWQVVWSTVNRLGSCRVRASRTPCQLAITLNWSAGCRLTGLKRRNSTRIACYLRLLQYRNKVAAHFALTDPRRDNEADLAASVMTQVVYARGRLCQAALIPYGVILRLGPCNTLI